MRGRVKCGRLGVRGRAKSGRFCWPEEHGEKGRIRFCWPEEHGVRGFLARSTRKAWSEREREREPKVTGSAGQRRIE